jgi:hypothetical protein
MFYVENVHFYFIQKIKGWEVNAMLQPFHPPPRETAAAPIVLEAGRAPGLV